MTTTTYRSRRTRTHVTVAVAAIATGTAAVVAAAVVLLPTNSASAAVLDAASQTGKTGRLRAALSSGTSSATGEFVGNDSKVTSNDAGRVTTVVELGNFRYSFADDDQPGINKIAIGPNEPRRAPITTSAADVIRALVDDENVTEIGDEAVRGTTATHYRVAVSAATRKDLTAVDPTERVWFDLEQVDGLRTVDVWVSHQLIRRIETQGRSGHPAVTEFFDFDAPITIRAPRG